MLPAIYKLQLTGILLLCAAAHSMLHAQSRSLQPRGTTRAVVVGISEYRDSAIGDLRFAHRDAESFAAYLLQRPINRISSDHIQVLLNEDATLTKFGEALQWLIDSSADGDHVWLYFSGHGEIGRTITRPEYLLLYDASPISHLIGAIEITKLQEIISTLSVERNVKVTVILDACRSGKMEERQTLGISLIGEQLYRQKANELKILSCKADELSREGPEWNGGVFTYYLLRGLNGEADQNEDQTIDARELRNYLEVTVSSAVAPARQTPVVLASQLGTTVELVSPDGSLATIGKTTLPSIAPAYTKWSRKDHLITSYDSSDLNAYKRFQQLLEDRIFFEPASECAEKYYGQLMGIPYLESIHGDIQRQYLVALQEEAHRIIKNILDTELQEATTFNPSSRQRNNSIPSLLDRASDIATPSHHFFNEIIRRRDLFKGINEHWNYIISKEEASFAKALAIFSTLQDRTDEYGCMANYYIARMYSQKKDQREKTVAHLKAAISLQPQWALPYAYMAFYLIRHHRDFEEAKYYLDAGNIIDPNNKIIWMNYGAYYFYSSMLDSAVHFYTKVADLEPGNAMNWANLGAVQIARLEYHQAERALSHALEADSTSSIAYFFFGCLHRLQGKNDQAEHAYLKSLDLRPGRPNVIDSLVQIYLDRANWNLAEDWILQWRERSPSDQKPHAYLAAIALKENRRKDAVAHYKAWQGLSKGDITWLKTDPFAAFILHDPHLTGNQ
jgi:protein O-mannosyl-transferase